MEELGVKLSLGRRKGLGGRCFQLGLYLLLSYSIFTCQFMKLTCCSTILPSHVGNVGFCLLSSQEGAQVTFLHPEYQLDGENPLGGPQQPELAEASGSQYDPLACGQQRQNLQLQSPVSGTRGWVLPHPVLLGIPCFTVQALDH